MLNTAHSGFVAYDLPGTADAQVLWGTGRGNYQRTGAIVQGTLRPSRVSVEPVRPAPGATLSYTIRLINPGPTLPAARVTSTLPAELTYLGNLWASAGSYGAAGGVITWAGAVGAGVPVTITYGGVVDAGITEPTAIVHPVLIDDGLGNVWPHQALAIVNGYATFLPLIHKD